MNEIRELCAGLRHCAHDEMCDDCDFGEACEKRHACDRAADMLEKMHEELEWRDAEIELPVDSEEAVLVIVSDTKVPHQFFHAVQIGRYDDADGWIVDGYEEREDLLVEWWKPLPELPDKAQKEIYEMMKNEEDEK